jgi:hypothetical protein
MRGKFWSMHGIEELPAGVTCTRRPDGALELVHVVETSDRAAATKRARDAHWAELDAAKTRATKLRAQMPTDLRTAKGRERLREWAETTGDIDLRVQRLTDTTQLTVKTVVRRMTYIHVLVPGVDTQTSRDRRRGRFQGGRGSRTGRPAQARERRARTAQRGWQPRLLYACSAAHCRFP